MKRIDRLSKASDGVLLYPMHHLGGAKRFCDERWRKHLILDEVLEPHGHTPPLSPARPSHRHVCSPVERLRFM